MRALILAAGRGTRISRYLKGNPKCTVNVGAGASGAELPLIVYTVDMLKRNGINDIALCVGYNRQAITSLLDGKGVKFFYNPFYDVTNSIASAWFAKDFFEEEDTLIMNGDVYMEEKLLKSVISEKKSPILFSDETRKEEADYKFKYENGILLKYGKELEGDDITGEYVGIAKLGADYIPKFLAQLSKMIDEQKHGVWWENVLYELSSKSSVYVKDVNGEFWAEVDYIEDYKRILAHRGTKYVLEQLILEGAKE